MFSTDSVSTHVYPNTLVKEINQSATFYCPGLKVTWKHHEGPLPDNAVAKPLKNINKNELRILGYPHWSILKIRNVQPHNFGYYQCYREISHTIVQRGTALLRGACEYVFHLHYYNYKK